MENIQSVKAQVSEAPPRLSEWRRFRRVFFQRKLVIFGLIVLFIVFVAGIFAGWIAPYDPYKGEMSESLLQPSFKHLLGTDLQGETRSPA